MSVSKTAPCVMLLFCLLAVGCTSKPAATTGAGGEDGATSATPKTGSVTAKLPIKRNVKELDGNWVVVVSSGQADVYRWIVKFSKDEQGKYKCEFADTSRNEDKTENPQIVKYEINGDSIQFDIKTNTHALDYQGQFHDGFIRGTLRVNPVDLMLTRLLPTDEATLEKFAISARQPGSDVYAEKLKSENIQAEDLLTIAREYKTSPLAMEIMNILLRGHAEQRLAEDKFKELADEYVTMAKIWGPRYEARVEMSIAVTLINARLHAKLAEQHLDAAEKLMQGDHASLKDPITAYRDAARANLRIEQVTNPATSEELLAEAVAELSKLIERQPYNAEILNTMANHSQKIGQTDKAIEYLSEICALPLMEIGVLRLRSGQPPDTPTPTELLKKLWIEKHGSEEKLESHLRQTYDARIDGLLSSIAKKQAETPLGEDHGRTVLVELFTSMMSPHSVAANLALSAIGKVVPRNRTIILQFHQHIPFPDSLTSQDSEQRGAFYEMAATPTVVIDGIKTEGRFYSGPLQATPGAADILRKIIDARLAVKSDVKINLSATVANGQLSVNAEVTGVPEEQLPSCRLRIALVEDNVKWFIPFLTNGINDHQFVVREMLGGAEGVPPKRGEFKYSTTLPFDDIQRHVTEYISRFEAGRRTEFTPPMKPALHGPFSLVAWVQNDSLDPTERSKLVLQSTMIPITGDAAFEAATKSETSVSSVLQTTAPATTSDAPAAATVAPATNPEIPAATTAPAEEPANAAAKEPTSSTPPAPSLPE